MNIKRLSSVLIVAVFVQLFMFTSMSLAQAAPKLWLSSDVQQVSAGQEFTVNVNVSDAVGVYGGSFKLNYDSVVLEALLTPESKAVTPGAFFDTQSSFTLTNRADAGVIEYALTLTQPAQPVDGSGVLGTVTFRALTDAAVNLELVDTRLLAPEFSEVDGRLIARKINEVETQVENLAITVGNGSLVAVVPTQPVIMPTVSVQQLMPETAQSAPVTLPASTPQPRTFSPILIVGGLLFIVGLGLFAASLGAYIRLRREYALVEQEPIAW